MAIRLETASQQTANNGVKILVHGRSGMGKTVLSATLGQRTIMVSAEAGALSLQRKNLERIYGVGNPDINYDMHIIVVETVSDFHDAYDWIMSEYGKAYEAVAIDSLSEIAEKILANEKAKNKDGRMAYGNAAEEIEKIVRKFRDIPNKTVYMSAKTEMLVDGNGGGMKYFPMMPGKKTGQILDYFFDEVFYFDTYKHDDGKVYRVLHTQVNDTFTAKDRSGALDAMEAPNLSAIIRKIKG
ncbi:putative ATPase [Stenotrophomonas phage BUCT626]|uniref:ATPase n=2 Tax=Bixiavirus TaxID=3044676 RepID=A0AC61NA71_9CAUD|nr:putative ATPase [Stenotrophomonas phage vB_SmaS_BUCT548]YP_010677383.1 putative ATPase [Stenotrophomonas phage BUCT626]QIQ60765.1 putative ATPase [Stenotrophomonas phage vB_SmaS_BUCT548]QYC96779.1 putative ATPase [Stenotrophomonas phage BUCT626]